MLLGGKDEAPGLRLIAGESVMGGEADGMRYDAPEDSREGVEWMER